MSQILTVDDVLAGEFRFQTISPQWSNDEVLEQFLGSHVDEADGFTFDNVEGTYAEVTLPSGETFEVHAGGDGDSYSHLITFASLNDGENQTEQVTFNEEYKTVGVCTNHMTYEDSLELSRMVKEDASMIAERPTGFFVKLYEEDNAPYANLSPALNAILMSAANQGYRCVEFDSDAPEVDGAPSFNW